MDSRPSAKTVLIVDDEPDILASLRVLLETSKDIRAEVASSGKAALAILARSKIDLIVTDYKMPEMNGVEFLERVQKDFGSIPTIMITAFPDAGLARRVMSEFGVRHFVPKPLDIEFFLTAIRRELFGHA